MRISLVRPALIGLAILGLAPAAVAQEPAQPVIRKRTAYEDLQMFSQVLNQIRVNHPDSVDTHRLYMAAVEGMVQAADPHSYVLPATRLTPEKEKALREGRLHPVPIQFAFAGGSPLVVSVAPGTTASRLDILPGDELVSVDGRPVHALSAEELSISLAGPRGSSVRLGLERRRLDGSLAQLSRTVRRETGGEGTAVPVATLLDGSTGYVRITTFMHDRVASDLHEAVERLEKGGMQGLVLDLRDNGGGSVEQAAKVASEFLPRGAVVYIADGRKAEVRDTARVQTSFWRRERQYPVVVMVNSGSASASELVAGALQDHDRALIVGRPTFGKALLMQGFPLSDGSVMMLVIGHLKTPCGRVVQRQYTEVTRRDYFRLARAERDTAGRPSCRTGGGRMVYGGGGIVPDVLFAEPDPAPIWLARAREQDLTTQWVGGYVTANASAWASADALATQPKLPAQALADFRAFAAGQGVVIPAGAEADAVLQRVLVRSIAYAKWQEPGLYRVQTMIDPEITAARKELGRAESMLAPVP